MNATWRVDADAIDDDRPMPCTKPGHVHGCAGRAGGDHELVPVGICFLCQRREGEMRVDLEGDVVEVCGPCFEKFE